MAVTGNDIGQAYQENRDLIRGIDTSFRRKNTQHGLIGITNSRFTACNCLQSLPLKKTSNLALTGLQKTGQLLANTGRAAAQVYGEISGAGIAKRIQPKSTK